MTGSAGEQRVMAKPVRSPMTAVVVFLAVLVAGGVPLYWVMAADPANADPWVLPLMWLPALAGLVARLVTRRRFLLGRPAPRTLLLSGVPIALVLLLYVLASALGLMDWLGWSSFVGIGAVALGLGEALTLVIGEELGWRGYLLPQLRTRYGFLKANLIVVVVWLLFHVPVMLIPGVYGNEGLPLWANVLFFSMAISGFGFFVGWLWELHHDVWGATSAHMLWNSLIQSVFTAMFVSSNAWLMGEFGVLAAGGMVALLVPVLIAGRRRREPLGDALTAGPSSATVPQTSA